MNQLSAVPVPPNAFDHAAQIASAVRLDRLNPADVAWLWPGRIPLGRLTILVGDPGLGKSLITLDIAARVSRAAPWPDTLAARGLAPNSPHSAPSPNPPLASSLPNPQSRVPTGCPNPKSPTPASVLLLNAEDDLADTVIPRLQAAGADCSRVVAIPAILQPYGVGDAPADSVLRRELARLTHLLLQMPDCRLVIIDPVSSYLAGSANASGEVRRLLAPLAQLAHERNLAVVAVSHLRKQDGAAIHRTLGSLTFVSAARAAWVVARDPADPSRRLMLPVKNNLSQAARGLAFQIHSTNLPLPLGEGRGEGTSGEVQSEYTSQPIIRWDPTPVSADTDHALRRAGRPRTERDDALRWLERKLAPGPLPARQLQEEAEAHGIRLPTLRRAFRELNGEAVHLGDPILQQWLWRLPQASGL